MSSVDDLPSWAGHSVGDGGNLNRTDPPPEPPRRRLRGALAALLILLGMAGMAYAGYWYAGRDDDNVSATDRDTDTADSADDSDAAGSTTDDTLGSETETETGDSDTDDSTDSDDGADADGSADTAADATTGSDDADSNGSADTAADAEEFDNSEGEIQHAVLKNGQVFLRGRIQSQELADEVVAEVGRIVGPENVFDEYEIDPSVPIGMSSPLYVEDVVLFDFNSIEIEPAFEPILDLGTFMLSINPDVKIAVVARTDAVGSEEVNLRVAEQRADAVIKYWTDQGVDPSRLIADPRGEEEASDGTAEEAALDRRVEFTIINFMGQNPEG